MKKIELSLLLSILATLSYSQDIQEESRDRHHSVKKAIASVQETPQKELDIVDGFNHMFKDAKTTGQILSLYSGLNYEDSQDIYATAVGGFLKYELAKYKGFSGATTFVFSQDVSFLSGSDSKYNSELSSSQKSYTQMSEVYIDYEYSGLKLRGGRQIIDTPLADSDDIRMVANSFEAYIATYEYESLSFMGGALLSWQGYDAGIDDPWTKTGEDNTYFGGLSWSDDLIDASLWYYNINGVEGDATANNSYYGDLVGHFHLSKEFFLHTGVQYLKQDELDKSGVASEIYGAMAEIVAYGAGLNIAYNKSLKEDNKQSFSGFGGGTLFTSMDNMIVDVIAVDRDVDAIVAGLSYEYEDFSFLYAYGDFKGSADSSGQKEHIVEQNIGATYEHEDITVGAIYTLQEDKENTGANDGDWNNVRVLLSYNF
jgi:hypothetical protein